MSNLIQQELEEQWYEEGLEIAQIKEYAESSWDLFAMRYVESMRRIYSWGKQHRTYNIPRRQGYVGKRLGKVEGM
jgi:hypothetical protein